MQKRFLWILFVLLICLPKGLIAQSFGIGLSPFAYLNLGVIHGSLSLDDNQGDVDTIADGISDKRATGYMPGLALEIANRLGILKANVHFGVSAVPKEYYIPPMPRFSLGVQGFADLPLGKSRDGSMVGGFLIGLGLDLFLGGGKSDLSQTDVTVVQLPLSLLLGASFTFQRQFELYFLLGPYISLEGIAFARTGYDRSFFIVSWGLVLPQIGFRLWF